MPATSTETSTATATASSNAICNCSKNNSSYKINNNNIKKTNINSSYVPLSKPAPKWPLNVRDNLKCGIKNSKNVDCSSTTPDAAAIAIAIAIATGYSPKQTAEKLTRTTTASPTSGSANHRQQPAAHVSSSAKLMFTSLLPLLLSFLLSFLSTANSSASHARSALLQHCSRHRLPRIRRCFCRRLLCSILCTQLLALTPLARGNISSNIDVEDSLQLPHSGSGGGSSSAALGLQRALGTAETQLGGGISYASNTQLQILPAIQGDALLADTLLNQKNTIPDSNIINAHASGAPDALLSDSNIVNFINRDHVLEGNAKLAATTAPVQNSGSGCNSCQMREKAKLENLESIKRHILARLQLSTLPNITAPIQVPHKIIENFYKNFSITGGSSGSGAPKRKSHNSGGNKAAVAAARRSHDRHYHAAGAESFDDEDDDAMQGDDPQVYATTTQRHQHASAGIYEGEQQQHDVYAYENEEQQDEYDYDDEDNFEEQFYSRVNSVYVFPTSPRMRHNRKPEILNFRLDNIRSTTISHAIVHVYLRGRDWIREFEPELLEQHHTDGKVEKRREIVITVHRAVRRQNTTNVTHTVKLSETRHKIPNGQGQWVQIDIKQLANFWTSSRNATQGIVIKGLDSWMRPFIVTGGSNATQNRALTVFIEVLTKDERSGRHKRSTSLDCSESDNEVRCCRYPLRVNFTNFGWTWVVAPTSFNAYFCNGGCELGFLEKHAHTHVASLSTSAQPCCSPTKMSSLKLLYFNSDQSLVLSTIPNMSVEKCSCS